MPSSNGHAQPGDSSHEASGNCTRTFPFSDNLIIRLVDGLLLVAVSRKGFFFALFGALLTMFPCFVVAVLCWVYVLCTFLHFVSCENRCANVLGKKSVDTGYKCAMQTATDATLFLSTSVLPVPRSCAVRTVFF